MSNKIRKNDIVVVLSGKDKGKRGKVKCVFLSLGKAIVSDINLVKKHQKSIPSANQPGGIVCKESLIHLSNLALFNSDTDQSDRVGFVFIKNRKFRFFKSNGKII
ncbi:50S ribosomal protein L24 [Candidatus Westeberhardia cardiocondylae]|uniref:Large ribosomal subunit protein uL24 n=1 Tax=Candidatus Westeberhardia cardiocondylae TaxID=1594731 RepID=A0A0H5BWH7_9ENTR|nr:50S ribosomal protein L24 [Candidatus Westeberhardia cardiocondylae]MCR3756173.1 50S ribosomal subunit protein L24 [Candidatus Westeberhardia cardiocondylae]CEN32050.1 50S ribosomal protein L24 [Candidatus Westeberhardia cardiocondylae]